MALFSRSAVKLSDFLLPERIVILPKDSKKNVLDKLISMLDNAPEITSKEELVQGIYDREKLMSTGIGLGIAIPHVRLASVKNIAIAAALVRDGIEDYDSLDGEPVRLVVMIVARQDQHEEHLRLLSSIASKLKNPEIREKIMAVAGTQELFDLLVR